MFAVVDIAGFQEKVSEGDKLRVPTLQAEEGNSVTFDKVLMLVKGDSDMKIGTPYVSGAAVEVKVMGHGRGDKIRVFSMKRRKRYRRVYGHRQGYTDIEVTKIKATGATAAKAEAPKAKTAEKTEEK
ncbi:50S ribosomal protein L21 [Candidatus Peregrinibacteria bacterium CG10_big_fil_rev_8_21_14_0_10_49_24]|nr:MAG: 50S ribosomal protein L21 [Candidatus Peregrinibacteria bacterium CG11_big_fil_rev_8_21_14_0_20_49_14]PIR51029.1 MAG: 50S ribosomal protein L21 [Candidatus Peregrinibacteria bacterium CG10_big_fil_rev_8_21_14_0_10_49_24]PJA67582.1 MAG: 50S ribosomal protein L21 [Candidatus Peregrinibacteria bacterium CG_4_9_14_3_um_filter_49_12]